MHTYQIERETKEEEFETEQMVQRAFWNVKEPGCREHIVVHEIRKRKEYQPQISRIAKVDGHVVGAIFYQEAQVQTAQGSRAVLSCGPLCVDPAYRNQGIGHALLHETLTAAEKTKYPGVIVGQMEELCLEEGFQNCDIFGITAAKDRKEQRIFARELANGGLRGMAGRFSEPEYARQKLSEQGATDYPILHLPGQEGYEMPDAGWYKILPATKDKLTFQRLFNEYVEELTASYEERDQKKRIEEYLRQDAAGNYLAREVKEYYVTPAKWPYLIQVENESIGLCVLSGPLPQDPKDGCSHYIEELYLQKEYRGRGIAGDLVQRFWKENDGTCGLCTFANNQKALGFWMDQIKAAHALYEKIRVEDMYFFRIDK